MVMLDERPDDTEKPEGAEEEPVGDSGDSGDDSEDSEEDGE